ncbi:dnaJsubfamily B member 9-like [Tropilaelaps mercedesae]|uniref:DnaJ homolog subfamily B member 9 n=1 Tax=Tropilaelaps mercedesae TaxID=418985 RepID=A0A1V9XY93_9ACAR|nr:dnaJsubfamily B member 9-like [Tropilaelaps mercedesae]
MRLCSLVALCTTALVVAVSASDNLYEILGVKRSSSQKDIKRAFRKLAIKYHPDKNKEKGTEQKFQRIARAYEILSNEDKRAKYDRFGTTNGSPSRGEPSDFDTHFNVNAFFQRFDEARMFHQSHRGAHNGDNGHFSFSFGNMDLNDIFHDDDDEHRNGLFKDFFSASDSFFGNIDHMRQVQTQQGSGGNCHTVTKRAGNIVSTYTTCS